MQNIKQQIINFILDKDSANKNNKFLGIEIEHFVLDQNNRSVFYQYNNGKIGVKNILEELSVYYKNKHYSNINGKKYIYELTREDTEISIEPGAQLEVSFSPAKNVSQIEELYSKFLNEIEPILEKHNYHLENLGYRPDWCAAEVPIVPRNRYLCMDAQFKNINSHGACMMRCSASVQVSIDFENEVDCINKLKIGTIIAPLIYFLYDNSPIFEKCKISDTDKKSTPSGLNVPKKMARYKIWQNTDNDRSLSLDIIFKKNFNIKKYVDKILEFPLLFSPKQMTNLNNERLAIKFNEDNFYPSANPNQIINNAAKLSNDEIVQILSFLFYDARLKNVIELRAADNMPKEYIFSYIAFIKGLMYSKDNINKLLRMFSKVTYTDYINAANNLYKNGWNATVYGQNIKDIFNYLFNLSKKSLPKDEQKYLIPTKKLIQNQKTLLESNKVFYEQFFQNIHNKSFKPISKTRYFTYKQNNYFLEHSGCIKNKVDRYSKHLKSKAIFENRVVDTAYFAKIYGQNSILQFSALVKTTLNILNKVIDQYYKDPAYSKLWKWDDFSQKLIDFCPKYSQKIPICRIDIFSDEKSGKFNICEFNTGGTAAQSEVSYLSNDAKYSQPVKYVLDNNKYPIKTWELYNTWALQFISIYDQWAANTNRPPAKGSKNFTVAIIDFLENSQIVDFYLFRDAFIKCGCNCIISDIRDLNYDGKNLKTIDGQIINAVYKRVTLNDFLPHKDHPGTKNFISAVFDHNVCPIDWFSTQIVHDKQISYILHNEKTLNLLSPSEINFVKSHIPETYRLNNRNKNNKNFIHNKNQYIIKPLNGRRSKDIFSGKEYSNKDWLSILEKCSNNDNFIIQKFCEQYTSPNILISQDHKDQFLNTDYAKQIKAFCNMDGLYCYNGVFSGVWLRQGDHSTSSIAYNVTCATFYEEYYD